MIVVTVVKTRCFWLMIICHWSWIGVLIAMTFAVRIRIIDVATSVLLRFIRTMTVVMNVSELIAKFVKISWSRSWIKHWISYLFKAPWWSKKSPWWALNVNLFFATKSSLLSSVKISLVGYVFNKALINVLARQGKVFVNEIDTSLWNIKITRNFFGTRSMISSCYVGQDGNSHEHLMKIIVWNIF